MTQFNGRFDITLARRYVNKNGEEKTSYTKVGTAFATKNGSGLVLKIESGIALLGTEDKNVSFYIQEPYDKEKAAERKAAASQNQGGDW